MNRYEYEIEYDGEDNPVGVLNKVENGEWLKLEDVIEFIRGHEPSLLTDFYAEIDVKRVQR